MMLIFRMLVPLAHHWHNPKAETKTAMKQTEKRLLVSIILTLLLHSAPLIGQPLTIDQCMAWAVEHSTQVGQTEISLDSRKADYTESVASLFPSVSGSVAGATNFGRSIDPATNTYNNITTFGNSYSLSGSMPLFAGLQGVNSVRAAKVARSMGALDVEIARDEVAIATLQAYMDVVYYTSAVEIAQRQLQAADTLLIQATRMVELGRKSEADLAEVASQVASYDHLLTEQMSNLSLAYLHLKEVMNWPADEPLEIVTQITIDATPATLSLDELTSAALANNPKMASSALQTRYRELQYRKAKGGYLPSLYLYGGINTNYYTNPHNPSAYDSFGMQFRNNRGSYIQLGLSIPLFSGLNRRSSVRRAQNSWREAELQQRATRHTVQSEVARTWQEMQSYGKQYLSGTKEVEAATLAYRGAEGKFRNGLISAIELRTAANLLLEAEASQLMARLQYIIRCRMVDYYNGVPLVRE